MVVSAGNTDPGGCWIHWTTWKSRDNMVGPYRFKIFCSADCDSKVYAMHRLHSLATIVIFA